MACLAGAIVARADLVWGHSRLSGVMCRASQFGLNLCGAIGACDA